MNTHSRIEKQEIAENLNMYFILQTLATLRI